MFNINYSPNVKGNINILHVTINVIEFTIVKIGSLINLIQWQSMVIDKLLFVVHLQLTFLIAIFL